MSSMLVNSPSLYPAAFFHFYYTKNFKNYKQKGKIYLLSYIATYQFLIYSSPVFPIAHPFQALDNQSFRPCWGFPDPHFPLFDGAFGNPQKVGHFLLR